MQASTIFFETLFETLLHLFNEPPPPLRPFQITDVWNVLPIPGHVLTMCEQQIEKAHVEYGCGQEEAY